MKKKKFIKMMMAGGISRNRAVAWSNYYSKQKHDYEEIYGYAKLGGFIYYKNVFPEWVKQN